MVWCLLLIANIYLNVYYRNYKKHLSCDAKQYFEKNKHVYMSFYQAAKAYMFVDINNHIHTFELVDIHAH